MSTQKNISGHTPTPRTNAAVNWDTENTQIAKEARKLERALAASQRKIGELQKMLGIMTHYHSNLMERVAKTTPIDKGQHILVEKAYALLKSTE